MFMPPKGTWKTATHLRICVSLIAIVLTSCGDDDEDPGTQEDKSPIVYLETSSDSEMLNNSMNTAFDVAENDNGNQDAIVMAGDNVDTVTKDADYKSLLTSYLDQGKPVVLLSSTADQANALTGALDIDSNLTDKNQVNWRALIMVDGQTVWTEHNSQFNVGDGKQQDFNFQSLEANSEAQQKVLDHSLDALNDYIASPLPSRLLSKISVSKSASAQFANKGELTSKEQDMVLFSTSSDASDDILDIVSAQTVQTVWDIYFDDDDDVDACEESSDNDDCDDYTSEYDYARYTITSYVYTFYEEDSETDYHYLVVDGNMAQSGVYTSDSSKKRGYYARYYGMYHLLAENGDNGTNACSIWSIGDDMDDLLSYCDDVDCDSDDYPILSQSDGFQLIESSPSTQQDCTVTSYTSSVSYSVTGSIATNAQGTSSSVTISDSTSYTTDDVCQYNYSGSTSNNEAVFVDDITAPTVEDDDFCYTKIDEPSGSATATFTPTKMWIWSTDSSVRDATDDEELIMCGALYYGWEKLKLKNKNCLFGTEYSKYTTYTLWGYVSYHNTFDLVDDSDD